MISVPIDRIIPLTDARDNFSRLVADVENTADGLYVLTKGGKPAIALISIKYLEELMGSNSNHESRITNHESSHKSEHQTPPKVLSPSNLSPEPRFQTPLSPSLPPPISFEVSKTTPPPVTHLPAPLGPNSRPEASSPSTSRLGSEQAGLPSTQLGVNGVNSKPEARSQMPGASSPSNYDVKPAVNPTWRGEEPKPEQPPATGSLAPSQSPFSVPPILKPEASSQSPAASSPADDSPRPQVNPWPIIPPRQSTTAEKEYESPTTVPPRQSPTAEPLATSSPAHSSLATSQIQSSSIAPASKPEASGQLPEASLPRMVAPPPPPPPSPLPRIPSSFQTVPVPINSNKPPGASSLASGQGQSSSMAPALEPEASSQRPVASSQMPVASSLPPPPLTDAPAPFSASAEVKPAPKPSPPETPAINFKQPSSASPKLETPLESKSSATIDFDQPPTTIPEPGEDLPIQPPVASKQPLPAIPVATPPQSQASVQDLEI